MWPCDKVRYFSTFRSCGVKCIGYLVYRVSCEQRYLLLQSIFDARSGFAIPLAWIVNWIYNWDGYNCGVRVCACKVLSFENEIHAEMTSFISPDQIDRASEFRMCADVWDMGCMILCDVDRIASFISVRCESLGRRRVLWTNPFFQRSRMSS